VLEWHADAGLRAEIEMDFHGLIRVAAVWSAVNQRGS